MSASLSAAEKKSGTAKVATSVPDTNAPAAAGTPGEPNPDAPAATGKPKGGRSRSASTSNTKNKEKTDEQQMPPATTNKDKMPPATTNKDKTPPATETTEDLVDWSLFGEAQSIPRITIQEFLASRCPLVKPDAMTNFISEYANRGYEIEGTVTEMELNVKAFGAEKKKALASKAALGGAPVPKASLLQTVAAAKDIYKGEDDGYDSNGDQKFDSEPLAPEAIRPFVYHKHIPKVAQGAVAVVPVERTFRRDMKAALLTFLHSVQTHVVLLDNNKVIALSHKAVRWFNEKDKMEGLTMGWAMERDDEWRSACNEMADEGGYSGPRAQEMYTKVVRAIVLATSTENMKKKKGVTEKKVKHFLNRADMLLGNGTVTLALNKSEQQALDQLDDSESDDDDTFQYAKVVKAHHKRPQQQDSFQENYNHRNGSNSFGNNQYQNSGAVGYGNNQYQNNNFNHQGHNQVQAAVCWSCGKAGHQKGVCRSYDPKLPFRPRRS